MTTNKFMIYDATIYEAWEYGKSGFGSFETQLLKLYQIGDSVNKQRLKEAFPEYFKKIYKEQYL